MRRGAYHAFLASIPGAKGLPTDVCVPLSLLPKLVLFTQSLMQDAGITGSVVGHAGDGNVHALVLYTNEAEEKKTREVERGVVRWAIEQGGTCTGEHGVGRGKREFLEAELGEGTVELLREIKGLLDPKGFMNPGALLPPHAKEGGKHA